jgi:hypothetical protein
MASTTAKEVSEFVRGKIKRHTELIQHHTERLEKYRAIENGLSEVRFLTGHINTRPESEQEQEEKKQVRPTGARCRFTPDTDIDEDDIIPEWEAEPEDFINAERVRRLGERFVNVKREEDQDSDDDLNKKPPTKRSSQEKKTTKRALIAEGHARARAWAAERPANPRIYSSPANLRAIQGRRAEEEKRG